MTNLVDNLQEIGMMDSLKQDRPSFNSSDIHIRRMRVAVLWSIILQFILLLVYILFISVDPFHPLSWIGNCFGVFLSICLWPKLLVLVVIIYIQGEVCKKDYVSGPVYYTTRFQKIHHLFRIRNLVLMLLYMIIGITMFWIYSSIPGNTYQFLTKSCDDNIFNQEEHCLVESKLFILLGGLWLGVFYFASDYIFGTRNLQFPLIQQYKFYRVKAALKDSIKQSLKVSAMPTAIFVILYYLYGGVFRDKFIELLSCRMDQKPIDSLQGLMDMKLILCLWLFSSIFIVALQTMELLFNVYLTEHCIFPITTEMLPPGNHFRLIDSLRKTDVPIIHHLGFLDLFTLSTKHQHRREEVFTLSHPGGHPHCWNGIYQECINLVKTFTSDLSQALQHETSSKQEPPKLTSKVEVSSFHFHSHNLRKLASPVSNTLASGMTSQYQSGVEIAFNNVQNWLHSKKEQVFKKPYIAYFFGESPDARVNYLFSKCQPVIWAVQSLAFLSAASFSEDRYGIVQKDLSNIIVAVVNLKQVVDKLFKQNLIVKKSFAKDPLDVQMKYMLRSSVKRSLYTIAVTFGPFIKDLQLPVDVEIQMNNFIMFKEV